MSENTMAETRDAQVAGLSTNADAQAGQAVVPVPEEVAVALEARAAFYETLAGLFWLPLTSEQVEAMAGQDFSAYAELNDDFAAGVNDITRYLRKRNTGTRDEMAVDFTGAFTGVKVYEGKTAVPYKSVFTSEDGLLYQEGYREVFRAFKAEAIKKREGLDYPDDHISFLCQFMAIMSRRTLAALREGDYAKAAHDVQASASFLDDNILSWYDQLMARAMLLLKTRFYQGVLKLAHGFFILDRETLTDMADEVAELETAAAKTCKADEPSRS
jgi:putative dimethyl sulfoxide reductase chaperone